jgi:hypothetical protein
MNGNAARTQAASQGDGAEVATSVDGGPVVAITALVAGEVSAVDGPTVGGTVGAVASVIVVATGGAVPPV